MDIKHLLHGTSTLEHITACSYNKNNELVVWRESPSAPVESKTFKVPFWMVAENPKTPGWTRLKGTLPLNHIKTFPSRRALFDEKARSPSPNLLITYDEAESSMQLGGFTQFKGLEPQNVRTLAFDIEATTLEHNRDAKVLLISNTFKYGNAESRILFAYDDYSSQGEMIQAWCEWVRTMDPSIIVGHNIYTYDFPYLDYCARRDGVYLNLGRDASAIQFNKFESKFRRDGSQFYHYKGIQIFGRQIVDTFFLSIKHDVARNYPSYGLKALIKAENLEIKGRQFYDASKIRLNYNNPTEWQKIRRYAEHDADDALNLYFRMIPAYFAFARMVPKSLQQIINGASGSQLNSLFIRAYLQQGHSLPLPTEGSEFEGAISIGNPGVYKNVFKVDVASLYPSIMLEYKVWNKEKDPLNVILTALETLTKERLVNKTLAKETGDIRYKSLEAAQKIFINSVYGFLGAPGLHFNSPIQAAEVTKKGREILQTAIRWATGNGQQMGKFILVGADTDSIAFCYPDGRPLINTEELLTQLNALYPARIRWEDDGIYERVLVLKAKNYVLDSKKTGRKIKGSALKATLKEPALREFIADVVDALIDDRACDVPGIYARYVREILNITDISRWCSKKTITENVLNPSRTNEQKVLDALDGLEYAQGDKLYFYFKTDRTLGTPERWCGDHDIPTLLSKLYKTLEIFESVYDLSSIPKLHLKRNRQLLKIYSNTIESSEITPYT